MNKWIIDDPEDKIVFTVTDPSGIIVYLYDEQWMHLKKHPETRPVKKVRSGVQNPDLILLNEKRNARIYTTISSTNLYFNVFAGIISETECKIRTSYITGTVPMGDCIWRRPKK